MSKTTPVTDAPTKLPNIRLLAARVGSDLRAQRKVIAQHNALGVIQKIRA